MNGYGLTEFGAVSATPIGDGGRHAGSVGRPLPGVALRIIDPDGSELPVGEVGQITVQDARHQRSYFHDPDASPQTWAGGWLHSGDLGYLDSDGFLWVVGRQKEIIIRGGHNIVPERSRRSCSNIPTSPMQRSPGSRTRCSGKTSPPGW